MNTITVDADIIRATAYAALEGLRNGQPPELLEIAFRQAVDFDPGDPDYLNYLVYCLLQQDKISEAGPYVERLAQLNPANAAIHSNIASYWIRTDFPEKAEFFIRRQLELCDESEQAHVARKLGEYLMARGRYEDATVYLGVAAGNQGDRRHDAMVHISLGDCYRQMGQHENSAHAYVEATRLNPPSALPYLKLCQLFQDQHEWQAARNYAEYAKGKALANGDKPDLDEAAKQLAFLNRILLAASPYDAVPAPRYVM